MGVLGVRVVFHLANGWPATCAASAVLQTLSDRLELGVPGRAPLKATFQNNRKHVLRVFGDTAATATEECWEFARALALALSVPGLAGEAVRVCLEMPVSVPRYESSRLAGEFASRGFEVDEHLKARSLVSTEDLWLFVSFVDEMMSRGGYADYRLDSAKLSSWKVSPVDAEPPAVSPRKGAACAKRQRAESERAAFPPPLATPATPWDARARRAGPGVPRTPPALPAAATEAPPPPTEAPAYASDDDHGHLAPPPGRGSGAPSYAELEGLLRRALEDSGASRGPAPRVDKHDDRPPSYPTSTCVAYDDDAEDDDCGAPPPPARGRISALAAIPLPGDDAPAAAPRRSARIAAMRVAAPSLTR